MCELRDCSKGKILRGGAMLLAPLIEEPAITESDVFGRIDPQALRDAVDPIRLTFELGVITNGSFVDDAMSFAVVPLGAPLLIAKGCYEAKREKHRGQDVAVGDPGLRFDTMLMAVKVRVSGARRAVGQALVRQRPSAAVIANAENFSAGAKPAVRRVIEDVALEATRSFETKTDGLKAPRESGQVIDAKFDFGFDSHR